MSNDDTPSFFSYFVPSREEIERMEEQSLMGAQAFYHEMTRFFEKLSDEDLKLVHSLISISGQHNERICGIIEGHLVGRGFCFACQKRHDESIDQILDDGKKTVPVEIIQEGEDIPPTLDPQVQEYQANLIKYNVKPSVGASVTCNGCGMVYQSLEDRMLRRPGGCDGCWHKAKWG